MIDLVSGLFKSIFDLMSGVVGFVLGECGISLSLFYLTFSVVVVVVVARAPYMGRKWDANRMLRV